MIIDFHTHFYPEKIVEKALATAREKAGIEPFLDGTRKGLTAALHTSGIDLAVALPIVTAPGKGPGIIKWAQDNNEKPIIMLGSVHPKDEDFLKTLDLAQQAGFPGVKVHPEYQSFSFDEVELDEVWQQIAERNMFLLTHAGEDSAYTPPFRTNPESLRKFHDRHPQLKLVLAHGGSWKMWDAVQIFLAGCDIYFDLAFVGECLPRAQYRQLVLNLGIERCLFGTDSPWCSQVHALELLHDLKLGSAAEEMILAGNAVHLLKL